MSKKSNVVNQNLVSTLNYIYENELPADVDVSLSLLSDRDKIWDNHRSHSQDVSSIYSLKNQFFKYHERIDNCSINLKFGIHEKDGLKLREAYFCHVRNCPVCQWRKSLFWKAMMYKTYDSIKEKYPNYRWLFLTLTVRNCEITDLRDTLKNMNQAWFKLIRRKKFNVVKGFVRTTEVTRDKKNPYSHAHPHFHCILLVDSTYFSNNYIKHSDWVEIWSDCLGIDYLANVDIRAVKSKSDEFDLRSVIAETLKYACKPSDMIHDNSQRAKDWFYEYTLQVHKTRFVATGGILKDALKAEKDITTNDMIALSKDDNDEKSETETDKRLLCFTYYSSKRSYIYNQKLNN